jgi:hydrogenase nickel incorporation protein HypB
MVARALAEFPIQGVDLLVVENVGNLICPASYDLGEGLRVVICSIAEGPEKPKKYPVMFHKADVVVLNKTDLAEASGDDLRELEANARDVNPRAAVFAVSCKTGSGIDRWLAWLESVIASRSTATAAGR